MKSKQAVAVLFIFLLLNPFLLAQEFPEPETAPEFSYDQFSQNPELQTADNFNQLSFADQVQFLATNYRNDFAVEFYKNPENVGLNSKVDFQYFGDANNVGKNPGADDQFFSGEYPAVTATTLRDFLKKGLEQRDAAAKYFSGKFTANYKFDEVNDDFVYDAAAGTLTNGGKIITLNEFKGDVSVQGIISIENGFRIIHKSIDEPREEISIIGTGKRTVGYNSDTGQLQFKDAEGRTQEFQTQATKDAQISFAFQEDGSLEIQGPVSGSVALNDNNYAQFSNRIGKLTIAKNGDITAENSEVMTRDFYADGKFAKKGNLVTAQDHGDRKKGNIDEDGRTVVVDRTSRVGVKTQGQSGEDTVKIHLNDLPKTADAAKPTPQTTEEARNLARSVRPSQGDLGKNAEVWIKKDEKGISVVSKGRVEVGFYDVGPKGGIFSSKNEPHFMGHNGKSEFELQRAQKTQIGLRGKADYSDNQYLTAGGETFGIHTVQDGSSLKITRDDGSPTDIIHADCFNCEKGILALRIQKTIVIGSTTEVPGVLADPEFHSLRIIVRVDDAGKLTYDPATKDLGFLARTQTEDKRIALGRDMIMKIPCGDKECNFQMRKEERLGTAQAFYEEFDGKETKTIPIDLGIGTVIGEAVIVTSNKNKDNLGQLMKLVQNKQFLDLQQAKLEFDKDPALRLAVLQRTGLDIDKINDAKYVERVETIVGHHTQAQQGIVQLQRDFGINLDENGRPQSREDAEKINSLIASRRGKEFDIYTKALENLARAKFADSEAAIESCQGNAYCPFSQMQLKNNQEEAKKKIVSVVKLREVAYQEAKVREWKYLQKHKPEGAQNAEANAAELGRTIKENEKERLRAESTLRGTRENPGAEARSAAAKKKYEQLREEHHQNIETARVLETRGAGKIEVEESKELLAAREEYYQERDTVNSLKKSLQNAQTKELNAHDALGSLAFQFSERPDVQANLYHAADMTTATANFVAESKSLSDAAKANLLQQFQGYSEAQALDKATFLANLDDDQSTTEAAALLHSLKEKRSDIHVFPEFQRANDALTKTLIRRGEEQEKSLNEQIGRMQEQAHERTASIVEGPNDWDRPGFFGGVDIVGHSVGRALSRWETVLPDIITLGEFSDAKTEIENSALAELTRQRDLTRQRNQILQAYADRGLSAADAFKDMSRGKYDPSVLQDNPHLEGTQVPLAVDGNSLILNELANGRRPAETENGRAALAAAAVQEAENEELFHYGKLAPVEAQWLRVIQEHPNSPQAAIARERLKALDEKIVPGLITRRTEEGVRDIAISLLTPDTFVGLGVTKTLTAAVKGTRLAAAAEKAVTAGKIAVYGTQETKAALNLARVELKAKETVKDVAQIERAQAAYRTAREAAEVEAKAAFETGQIQSLGRQVKTTPYRRELAREYNQQAARFSEETSKLHEARRAGDSTAEARALTAQAEAAAEMGRVAELDNTAKLAGSDAGVLWDRTLGRKLFVSDQVKDAEKAFQQAQKAYRDERLIFGEARVSIDTRQNLLRANENVQQAWTSAGNQKIVTVVQQEAGKLPPNEAQELRLLTTKLNQEGALLETKGVTVRYTPQTVPVSAVSDAARAEELAVKIDLGDVVVDVRKEQDVLKAFADSEFVAASKQQAAAGGKEIAEVIPLRRKVPEKPGVRSDIVDPCNLAAAAVYGLAPCGITGAETPIAKKIIESEPQITKITEIPPRVPGQNDWNDIINILEKHPGMRLDESSLEALIKKEELLLGSGGEGIVLKIPEAARVNLPGVEKPSVIKIRNTAPGLEGIANNFPEQAKILNRLAERGAAPHVYIAEDIYYIAEKLEGKSLKDTILERLSPEIRTEYDAHYSLYKELQSQVELQEAQRVLTRAVYEGQLDEVQSAVEDLTAALKAENVEVADFHWNNVIVIATPEGKLEAKLIDAGFALPGDSATIERVYDQKLVEVMTGGGFEINPAEIREVKSERTVAGVSDLEIEEIELPNCLIGGALAGQAVTGPCISAEAPTVYALEEGKQFRVRSKDGNAYDGKFLRTARGNVIFQTGEKKRFFGLFGAKKETTALPIENVDPSSIIREGDRIRITSKSGNSYFGTYAGEDADFLRITDDAGKELPLRKDKVNLDTAIGQGEEIVVKNKRGHSYFGRYETESGGAVILKDDVTGRTFSLNKERLKLTSLDRTGPFDPAREVQRNQDEFFALSREESIGGNAGTNNIGLNFIVDKQTGRILGVGNIQNLPARIRERGIGLALRVDVIDGRIINVVQETGDRKFLNEYKEALVNKQLYDELHHIRNDAVDSCLVGGAIAGLAPCAPIAVAAE